MPFDCRHRQRFGQDACRTACPATAGLLRGPGGARGRRARAGSARRSTSRCSTCTTAGRTSATTPSCTRCRTPSATWPRQLTQVGLRVPRAVVRRSPGAARFPTPPGGRHALYVGTGGPGHLDPRKNDGIADGAQGINEDPSWEAPLFRLFDAIRRSDHGVLLGVCHTFGVMCRWLGVADAGACAAPEKGGKSSGIVDNILTDAGALRIRGSRGLPTPCPTAGTSACSTTGCTTSCPRGRRRRAGVDGPGVRDRRGRPDRARR